MENKNLYTMLIVLAGLMSAVLVFKNSYKREEVKEQKTLKDLLDHMNNNFNREYYFKYSQDSEFMKGKPYEFSKDTIILGIDWMEGWKD